MKRFNIVVLPDDGSKPVGFAIGKGILFLIGLLFLLMSASGVMGLFFLFGPVRWNWQTERENKELRKRLSILTARKEKIEAELARLKRDTKELYALLELPHADVEGGIGGPELKLTDELFDSLELALFLEKKLLNIAYQKAEKRKELLRYTPTIKPTRGYLTSGYGIRLDPWTGKLQLHEGIDLAAPRGTPVYASADGRVKFTGYRRGYGKVVRIDHNGYYETRYCHLDAIRVRRGQRVKRGELIGTVGRTGRATGTHLHYEVRVRGKPVNPLNYLLPERSFN